MVLTDDNALPRMMMSKYLTLIDVKFKKYSNKSSSEKGKQTSNVRKVASAQDLRGHHGNCDVLSNPCHRDDVKSLNNEEHHSQVEEHSQSPRISIKDDIRPPESSEADVITLTTINRPMASGDVEAPEEKGRRVKYSNRPSNISVPSCNLLGLPTGLSPKEEQTRERKSELDELAAVARMLSGESSSIKRISIESAVSGNSVARLSPGIVMPGSPGFGDDELREWERRGLDMLE